MCGNSLKHEGPFSHRIEYIDAADFLTHRDISKFIRWPNYSDAVLASKL